MFVTADQIVVHLIADFFVQHDGQALGKKLPGWRGTLACLSHVATYAPWFILFTRSWAALAFIAVTHYVLDRTHLVAFLIWLKNQACPRELRASWAECKPNSGFHPSRPPWIAVWIGIVVDNTFHLLLNALAIRYL